MRKKDYFDIFAGIGLVDYALDANDWELSVAIDYDEKKYLRRAFQWSIK